MSQTLPTTYSKDSMTTKSILSTTLSTMKTTARVLESSGKQKKNDYWMIYVSIIGAATGLLIICTMIVICASRYRSLRKAKKRYEKERKQVLANTLQQKRDSEQRLNSSPRGSTQSTEAFYVQDLERGNPDCDRYPDQFNPRGSRSYVQAIPAFSKAIIPGSDDGMARFIETPPPRLSPSFQTSAERGMTAPRLPPRRHSTDILQPRLNTLPIPTSRSNGGLPPILPREPVSDPSPPRHPRRNSSPTFKPAGGLSQIHNNPGYIPEENEQSQLSYAETESKPKPDSPGA
eukprot:gene6148-6854_t